MKQHPPDRFWSVVVRGETSRRLRDVIRRGVNPALQAWFRKRCEEIAGDLVSPAKVDEMVRKFHEIGVDQNSLERIVGMSRSAGWTSSTRLQLLGIWNAIKDGDLVVEQLIGEGST